VDITFWTPGTEYTVFHHPKFDFATPICFEDVFPGVVRRFATEGMEVIVNITNDYWSLQEQAAQQHMAAALFRTVELGMPMVRSTASGVTSHIDARGRLVATVPQYSEQILVADVTIPPETKPKTMYYRWGDWFPKVALGTLAVLLIASYISSGGARLRPREIPESEAP
jgi:apolipoprotein N-acyltransferase